MSAQEEIIAIGGQLTVLNQVHDQLRAPWFDANDMRGWATGRKKDLKRRRAALYREIAKQQIADDPNARNGVTVTEGAL